MGQDLSRTTPTEDAAQRARNPWTPSTPCWPLFRLGDPNPLGIDRLEDAGPPRRGRKQTTGRFDSRAELEDFVIREYYSTSRKVLYIARAARVSEATVHNIIDHRKADR